MLLACAFTACSSDSDVAEDVTSAERGVVKTEFTISFPAKVAGTTRMSDANVQDEPDDFRGISDIELYPFDVAASSVAGTTAIPSRITLWGSESAVAAIGKQGVSGFGNNTISSTGALYSTSHSHLYQNVDVPIGTKSFMFYGEASRTNDQSVAEVGAIKRNQEGTTLSGITFSPVQIHPSNEVGASGDSIASYLTSIAQTKVGTTDAVDSLWAKSPNVGLQTLFQSFITMTAGSWNNVKAAMQEMYDNLEARTADNANTIRMKEAIRAAIANSAYGVSVSGDGRLSFAKTFNNYPVKLGLPEGAAYVKASRKSSDTGSNDYYKYEFKALNNNGNTGLNAPSLKSYVHPAALYYRVISNIKTSSESMANNYTDGKTWKQILDAYTTGTEVERDTRSIAITDSVQYAVGRLKVTLKADGNTLQDKAETSFPVSNTTYFPVSAILVGGQKPVDFQFHQISDDSEPYTIYDQLVGTKPQQYLRTEGLSVDVNHLEGVNHLNTLAFETVDATEAGQAVAKIAVEFTNNSGQTIWGANGQHIPNGCKFYLVGKLDPWDNTTQKYVGTDTAIKKAFVQDYTTTANLTIKSLKNAYYTLPDLTVPTLELGLAVDLDWKDGINANIDIE